MRVSKKLRAEAILICAVAASADIYSPLCADSLVVALDVDQDAGELADQAWDHVEVGKGMDYRAIWAEAEAMLQTGWCPS